PYLCIRLDHPSEIFRTKNLLGSHFSGMSPSSFLFHSNERLLGQWAGKQPAPLSLRFGVRHG
ncbi:hypothetical protein N9L04_04705, partial [Alphaproteobacteria bacterium]|nr:hypothetical protein [Alphaproteobacteria bacterium]